MAKKSKLPELNRENLLNAFWMLMVAALVGGTFVLFQMRHADRNMVISTYANNLLEATLEDHPDSTEAIEALMVCIQKKIIVVDNNFDEKAINRPRKLCPKYATLLEATHPSPMGMHDLQAAFAKIILGLKAKL
jgi:hypothetical protein